LPPHSEQILKSENEITKSQSYYFQKHIEAITHRVIRDAPELSHFALKKYINSISAFVIQRNTSLKATFSTK
jgi:hypothetical protein